MAHLRGNDTTGRVDEEPQMTELARNCWLTESECPDFPSITGKCWFSSTNSVKVSTENHNFTRFFLSSSPSVLSICFSPILPFPIASTFADRLALRKSPYHRPRPQHQSTGNPSGWLIRQQQPQPQQQETKKGERRHSFCPACFPR